MTDHGELMDSVYRTQRHFYDLTRKYYLLGRDALIADLAPPAGGSVLEIGCGTGRNLAAVGKAWPEAQLFGIDISEAMLETARASLAKAGVAGKDATNKADAARDKANSDDSTPVAPQSLDLTPAQLDQLVDEMMGEFPPGTSREEVKQAFKQL